MIDFTKEKNLAITSSQAFRKLLMHVLLVSKAKGREVSFEDLERSFEEIVKKHKREIYDAGVELYLLGILDGKTTFSEVPKKVFEEVVRVVLDSERDMEYHIDMGICNEP